MNKSFEEVYADGIEEINMENGIVTLSFMTIQPFGDPKNPDREIKASVQMNFDQFMKAYNMLGKLGGVMAEKGIIGVRKAEDNKGLADFKKPN
jgi:hypothetical protein